MCMRLHYWIMRENEVKRQNLIVKTHYFIDIYIYSIMSMSISILLMYFFFFVARWWSEFPYGQALEGKEIGLCGLALSHSSALCMCVTVGMSHGAPPSPLSEFHLIPPDPSKLFFLNRIKCVLENYLLHRIKTRSNTEWKTGLHGLIIVSTCMQFVSTFWNSMLHWISAM